MILRRAHPASGSFPAIVEAERADHCQTVPPQGQACAACGSPVERVDRFCAACGQGHAPDKPLLAEAVSVPPRAEAAGEIPTTRLAAPTFPASKYFRCENCGSQITADSDRLSYSCPFCDSNYVVEFSPAETGRQLPEFVIGFAVTPTQAAEAFRQWIRQNSWFRPGDLDRSQLADKIQGVYLPFWIFSLLAQSRWSAVIGEHWYRTETYTTKDANGKTTVHTRRVQETEWWPCQGKHHQYYSGYLVSASHSLSQADADRIKPFELPAMKRYEPYFLAGWLAEEYSVPHDQAWGICEHEILQRQRQQVAAFLPGDLHRDLDVQTTFSHINGDLCLLPTYILSYRYRERLFRFLVNGQTGRVAGEKPLSKTRISIAAGIVVALMVAVALLALMIAGR